MDTAVGERRGGWRATLGWQQCGRLVGGRGRYVKHPAFGAACGERQGGLGGGAGGYPEEGRWEVSLGSLMPGVTHSCWLGKGLDNWEELQMGAPVFGGRSLQADKSKSIPKCVEHRGFTFIHTLSRGPSEEHMGCFPASRIFAGHIFRQPNEK